MIHDFNLGYKVELDIIITGHIAIKAPSEVVRSQDVAIQGESTFSDIFFDQKDPAVVGLSLDRSYSFLDFAPQMESALVTLINDPEVRTLVNGYAVDNFTAIQRSISSVGTPVYGDSFEHQPFTTDITAVELAITGSEVVGGTDFNASIMRLIDSIKDIPSNNKSIMLITDGASDSNISYEEMLEALLENDISVTAVSFGGGADVDTLITLSLESGGSYFHANDEASFIEKTKEALQSIVEVQPVYKYQWTLDDGTVVGTEKDIVWTVPEDTGDRTKYRLELDSSAYLLGNDDELIYQCSTKTYKDIYLPPPLVEALHSFSLSNNIAITEYPYSNMDISRFLSYFPKWSSANKNFYSNTSKVLSPLLEQLSNSADRYDTYIENNSTDGTHFGYKEYEYEIITGEIPRFIRTEHGLCSYVGENLVSSIESIPIRATEEVQAYAFVKEKHIIDYLTSPITLIYPSYLFIKDIDASIQNVNQVTLVGMNESGVRITETVNLISSVPVETLNKFKAIYKVVSLREIEITTYLDLVNDTSFSNGINLQKRITNKEGVYFDPLFSLDDNKLQILNSNELSRRDEFTFVFSAQPQKYFVNNLLDVISLRDNVLYGSKLMLDYYGISSENSSTNNNDFVYVENENTNIGENLNVTLNISKLAGEYGSSAIRVALSNSNEIKYLDNNISLSDDKNTWLQIDNISNKVSFSIPVTNNDPYIIELRLDNKRDPFYAMGYTNKITEYKIAEDVSDIFIYNKELWKESSTGDFYTLKPIRLGFTSSVNKIHLFNDFNNVEFI